MDLHGLIDPDVVRQTIPTKIIPVDGIVTRDVQRSILVNANKREIRAGRVENYLDEQADQARGSRTFSS